MSKAKVRTLRALVRIRIRRQEAFDRACVEAQSELKIAILAAEDAGRVLSDAEENTSAQNLKIEQMTTSGNRFQIGHYLDQQDYLSTLQQEAQRLGEEDERANEAVQAQAEVLRQARSAAAHNIHQRERLEEQLAKTTQAMDCADLDQQDEEAEEAITARLRRQHAKTQAESAPGDHA